MPPQIREQFAKSDDVSFDIKKTYLNAVDRGESSKIVLENLLNNMQKSVLKIVKMFMTLWD